MKKPEQIPLPIELHDNPNPAPPVLMGPDCSEFSSHTHEQRLDLWGLGSCPYPGCFYYRADDIAGRRGERLPPYCLYCNAPDPRFQLGEFPICEPCAKVQGLWGEY